MAWMATEKQLRYIARLSRDLRLPADVLNVWLQEEWHGVASFTDLTKSQASQLIDRMTGWDGVLPAALMRRMGQADLPGLDGVA